MEEMDWARRSGLALARSFSVISRNIAVHVHDRAGQVAGMSRASALEFSFFLSMPTMAVATLYELLKSLRAKGEDALAVGHMTRINGKC